MSAEGHPPHENVLARHWDEVPDYQGLVQPKLPVLEASVTMLGRGPDPSDMTLVSSEKVTAIATRNQARSVGITIMKPAYFAFASWAGTEECRINGELAEPTKIYRQGWQDGFHIHGGNRKTIGIAVLRSDLVETIAALRGVGPEDVQLGHSALDLSPGAATRFRARLVELMRNAYERGRQSPSQRGVSDPGEEIFALLVDAYLHAEPQRSPGLRRRPPERIVRAAEERYFAADGASISLADLCAAAAVSQRSLYRAFHQVCGETPLAYFHKRSLMKARAMLLHAYPERGAVKAAAIDTGLTELGRFSVQYRQLFGESPSATLNKAVML